jgi:hypothetical protein
MKVKAICNWTLNKVNHIDEKYNLAISTLVAGEMLLWKEIKIHVSAGS